jgi:hypothetical protein
MRVTVDTFGAVAEPYLDVYREHGIRMALGPGFIDHQRRSNVRARRLAVRGRQMSKSHPS